MLGSSELSRYARQLVLPEVGIAGQETLRDASVLIVGAGGLGSPAALYLAAAGVGVIGILDDDTVELSNLHRQILHGTEDLGRPKAESGADALRRVNDACDIRSHPERLSSTRAESLLDPYDLIIDGSDNYPTRYLINDTCATLRKPWIYGSVERFAGQVSVFGAVNGPCYRCLFPQPPAPGSTASCEEIGVLGAVPGVVGSLQALEALKCLLGVGTPLVGRLLQLDLLSGTAHVVEFSRRADCPSCGAAPQNANRNTVVDLTEGAEDIEPRELAKRLQSGEAVVLIDVREPWELAIGTIAKPQHIPMNELADASATFDRERELILYCHHGVRSGMAAEWLRRHGLRARSLAGGIDRWSREIDSAIPRY